MQKIIYALATLIFLAAFGLPPQGVKVTGKVVDETGAPIPYATVQEKGIRNGVSCNAEGDFSIKLRSTKSILRVQAIHYATRDFLIKDTLSAIFTMTRKPVTCSYP